jgi:hypothetical protein
MKKTLIISAFPGTGKSFLFLNSDKLVLDSDSSNFDKKDFPKNYIKHIKKFIGIIDIICVSSHKIVRDELVKNNLNFILSYPDINLKQQYINRFLHRGNNENFIKLLSDNWERWIEECKNQKYCKHLIMADFEYLSDYF